MIKKKEQKITKEMKFSEILERYPDTIEILFESGMHCIGCPMASQETLEQGIIAHGLDINKILKKLNNKIDNKKIKKG